MNINTNFTTLQRILLTSTFVLMALECIFAQKNVVWEKPVVSYTQYSFFELKRVELEKDRTSLYMQITFPPESWFRFSPQSYIEADGLRYEIIGSDSIDLGEMAYTSPKTRKKEFVLHFKPIPQNTKVFDMLESTQKGDFAFYYIHPNNYKIETPVPEDFHADYPEEDIWPDNTFGEEPAIVHFKALNYKKGMKMDLNINVHYFDITNPNSRNKSSFYLDDEGCADYSCKVYYPTSLTIELMSANGFSFAQPLVAPGKEVTILIDMLRDDHYPNSKVIGYKGYFAKTDRILDEGMTRVAENDNNEASHSPNPFKQCKTVSDFVILHDSLMEANLKNILNSQNPPAFVKLFPQRIEQVNERNIFYMMYNECDSLFNTQEFRDYIFRTRPKCFFSDNLQIEGGLKSMAKLFVGSEEKGFAPDLFRFIHSMSELNSNIIKSMPLLDDPNLSQLYDQKRQEVVAKISIEKEGLPKNIHYLELAKVAPEQTLQYLLDRYEGKTIFLDLWATWCAPCRQSHKEMEPVKQELKNKNIVYVYITSPASSLDEWKEIAKTISGEHYYLSHDQFKELGRHYKSGTSVPVYVIYNPNGELIYKSLGFSQVEPLKLALMKALE